MTWKLCGLPYIGITGFMPGDPIGELLALLPGTADRNPAGERPFRLMVGLLVSEKTLHGIPNRWPERYTPVDRLADLLSEADDLRTLNLVHYNTKGESGESLGNQLIAVHQAAGCHPCLDGFQLNMAWPTPQDIEIYNEWRHDVQGMARCSQFVLQIGNHAFQVVDHDPKELVRRLDRTYRGLIDYILLDPSGGAGITHGPEFFRPYLEEIYSEQRPYDVGIAGGFGPGRLSPYAELLTDFPGLSIDAEGQLRDRHDSLDLTKAKEYIKEAMSIREQLPY